MAEQTTNFHLSLREAADIFNPLSTNDNFRTIDAKLYELMTKGGIVGYSGTVSANLLTLSGTPTENDTIFKVIPDGDCNTVSFSGAVRQILAPNGTQMTLKANTLYVCYMSSSAMVVLAWPDSVDANTFDGQSANYYATASSVAAVDNKADNAAQVAQAATTIANNALSAAEIAGMKLTEVYSTKITGDESLTISVNVPENTKFLIFQTGIYESLSGYSTFHIVFIGVNTLITASTSMVGMTSGTYVPIARRTIKSALDGSTCSLTIGKTVRDPGSYSGGSYMNITAIYAVA